MTVGIDPKLLAPIEPESDTDAIQVPFTKDFYLVEPSGDVAIRYREAVAKAAKFKDGKMTTAEGLPETDMLLLNNCVYENVTSKIAAPAKIKGVPNRLLVQAVKRLQLLGGLAGEESIEELKEQRRDLDERIKKMEEAADESKNE